MTPDEITVQSKGSGKDENEAIDKAIIAAVQQAMGVLVVSEITTSDEKVLSELAGMYSSGIVKSYEKKIAQTQVWWNVQLRQRSNHLVYATKCKSTQIVDGASLHGQYSSAKANLIQRKKLTEYYLSRIRSIGLQAKVEEIIPSMGEKAKVELSYSIGWNKNFRSEIISDKKN